MLLLTTSIIFHPAGPINFVARIKRFHSRDQRPYWFNETKESIEFNSQRVSLVHQYDCRSLFRYTNMAAVSSCENGLREQMKGLGRNLVIVLRISTSQVVSQSK